MAQSLTQRVASDVRAELGRQQVSGVELARRMQRSNSYVVRRLSGEVPFDMADLELVAGALGIPVTSLLPAAERVA